MGDSESVLVLEEKVNRNIQEIERTNSRIDKLEEKTVKEQSDFSLRLLKMETRSEIWNEMTNKKLDTVDQKLDNIIEGGKSKDKSEPKREDSFDSWVRKIGMKLIEYGVLAGILYGFSKGIKM